MDLNTPATTTIVNNQENNQLLLNAIKNKFAAQSANEAAAFSPPKFNIPSLKIPGNAKETLTTHSFNNLTANQQNASPATQLNQFLLKQLQEKHNKENGSTGFVVPQLQFGNKSTDIIGAGTKFELPLLRTTPSTSSNISSLTSAINKLQVEEHASTSPSTNITIPATAAIDLSTALASKFTHQGTPPTRDLNIKQKLLQTNEDFDIPFIECDRYDASVILATANQYCVTDISQLALHPTNVEPSCIGRFLDFDNKYDAPLPLKCFSYEYLQQTVKHTIAPFQFDTKSPDDIVLEALSKYHRRYYN